MCVSICYTIVQQDRRVSFPDPDAQLPVISRSGRYILLAWGRHYDQAGSLPPGGWARLDGIRAGRWDRWFPVPVRIPATAFMEHDLEGRSRWYNLTRGQWIQGLVARQRYERRVYVVTIEPAIEDAIHDRWPRIMYGQHPRPAAG